ncbi:MAG: type II secretion system protein [Armatimonadota bacterium]
MRRGVTVPELLGLLAILVIVFLVVWPVIRPRDHGSPQTTCLNNQKQIVTSILMFVQDHEKTFPEAPTWVTELAATYGVTGKVWDCPTSRFKGNEQHPDYLYFAGQGTFLAGASLEDITDPSSTPILADLKDAQQHLPYIDNSAEDVTQIIARIDCRHKGFAAQIDGRQMFSAIVGYVDGHINWLKADMVTDPQTYQGCIVRNKETGKR